MRKSPRRASGAVLVLMAVALLAAACSAGAGELEDDARVRVVTSVSPLRNLVENVGGVRVQVVGLVPEGTNAHTFSPPPSAARTLSEADLIVLNGLNLETPMQEMAASVGAADATFLLLGDVAVQPDAYVYDFSFPLSEGRPNPHLWTDPNLALVYAGLIRDALARRDPPGASYYAANYARFQDRILAMDDAFRTAIATIPAAQRKLLTYHDSFPYFGPRYGLEVIGAIQPSGFADPPPQEVAGIVRQIREAGVPAIFGSQVFPSEVLAVIASEVGAVQVSTLRDDDLPGDPGDPQNTYLAMMTENVRTLVTALGGNAAALDGFDTADTWLPLPEGTS